MGNDDNGQNSEESDPTASHAGSTPRPLRHRAKRKSFSQQYRESKLPSGVDKVLEELFRSKQAPTHIPQISRYSRTPKEHVIEPATLEKSVDYRLVELAQKLRGGMTTIKDAWASCVDLLREKTWIPRAAGISGPRKYSQEDCAFKDILIAICSTGRLTTGAGIVTPARVISIYAKHGIARYWWHTVLWSQLSRILQLQYSAEQDKHSGQELASSMKDLLEVWNLFLKREEAVPKHIALGAILQKNLTSGMRLPQASEYSRFLTLLPKHPRGPQVADMAAAAVMTLSCMEAQKIDGSFYLKHFFTQVKGAGKLDRSTAARCLAYARAPATVIDKALESWGENREESLLRLSSNRTYSNVPIPKPTNDFGWSTDRFASRMADIDGCAKKLDPEAAIELWANFRRYVEANNAIDRETKEKFFARFLRTFWALKRLDHAVNVWNYMIKSGCTPNQLHWTAMLTGCVHSRDAKSLQDIWSKMLRSGAQPDNHTWTTYITGLFWGKNWQDGFSALETLGKTWKGLTRADGSGPQVGRTRKDSTSPPVASMEPVHGALKALIDTQRSEHNPRVIAWAESQGLHLTTYTFNILLQPLVRAGNQEHIAAHLAQMQAHNCPPDVVTFTTILDGLVSNPDSTFHSLSLAEQESAITTMLSEMESHSIAANAYTYSTLLNGLVGKLDPKKAENATINIPAARTILAHMAKRNIPASSHIYTILITHYFSLSPPDLPAIDSLWNSIRHTRAFLALDPVFYNHLIESYADIDEYEKALSFLRRMPEEGKTPGWNALLKLLLALGRAGEWELCGQLVMDAEDPERLFRHGDGLLRGKTAFWDEVDRLRAMRLIDSGQD